RSAEGSVDGCEFRPKGSPFGKGQGDFSIRIRPVENPEIPLDPPFSKGEVFTRAEDRSRQPLALRSRLLLAASRRAPAEENRQSDAGQELARSRQWANPAEWSAALRR